MHNSYSKGLLKSSYVPICVPICHIVYVSSVAAGPSCLHFMLTNIQRSKLTYMSCLFGRHASYTCHVLRIWRCENIWNTIYYISLCQKASNFHSTIQLQQLLQWTLDVKIFPQITKKLQHFLFTYFNKSKYVQKVFLKLFFSFRSLFILYIDTFAMN